MNEDRRPWCKLTGGKEELLSFENPVRTGGYCFEQEFLDSSTGRILDESSGPKGASIEKLSGLLHISRAGVREILTYLVQEGKGVLVRRNFFSGENRAEKTISSFDRNILLRLKTSGREGLDPLVLKIPGSGEALERLALLGLSVKLDENLYWDPDILKEVCEKITEQWESGTRINVAIVRELTGLSRRYIIPVFHFMESSGRAERDGDYRILT